MYSSWQESSFTNNTDVNINEIESRLNGALKATQEHILGAIQHVGYLSSDFPVSEESLKNIIDWKTRFEKDIEHLQLDIIHKDVMRTIQSAVSCHFRHLVLIFQSVDPIDLLMFFIRVNFSSIVETIILLSVLFTHG